jgi:hypothetical protein
MPQGSSPGEIHVGGNRDPFAIGTLPGGKSIQKDDGTQKNSFADRASHNGLPQAATEPTEKK